METGTPRQRTMDGIVFQYSGRFAHFLRAEANVSAPSYPVPPRTVLLGLLGAVLGLPKDEPQTRLADVRLSVHPCPIFTHWHFTNRRQETGTVLKAPVKVTQRARATGKSPGIWQVRQEWLIDPDFTVFVASEEQDLIDQLTDRLQRQAFHFMPCLGVSEMTARLKWKANGAVEPLAEGLHDVVSVVREDYAKLDTARACECGVAAGRLRMPSEVTEDRAFTHRNYLYNRAGQALPVITSEAYCLAGHKIVWM
ncbi:MAG: CRISPR-associated protein Cas5 [Chloroflexia bacterium]|nr:CRISPR-associated protein Cas5 [Chloroflexia bacterium]